ncbi:hypothetical protein EJD97_002626, partial [Solanum chilense]
MKCFQVVHCVVDEGLRTYNLPFIFILALKFLTPASDFQGHWDLYPIDMKFIPPCMILSTIGISKPDKFSGHNIKQC